MNERSRYVKPESKEKNPTRPTFFLCRGTSGAGLTTAVNAVVEEGLAVRAPAQFVTRRLRANEKRGGQYYPITREILNKIPQQIALEDTLYGNIYGFFYPAIERIITRAKQNDDLLTKEELMRRASDNAKNIKAVWDSDY